ncbi:MAG: hypothetical protein ACREIU_08885 [Planctomycetota bacterium]
MIATSLLLILGAGLRAEERKHGISWERDLPSAAARSAREGRPVLLYFTSDG